METYHRRPQYAGKFTGRSRLERFRKLVRAFAKGQTVVWVFLLLLVAVLAEQVAGSLVGIVAPGVVLGAMLILLCFALVATAAAADVLEFSVVSAVLVTFLVALVPGGALVYVWLLQGRLRDGLKEFGCEPGILGLDRAKVEEIEAQLVLQDPRASRSVGF